MDRCFGVVDIAFDGFADFFDYLGIFFELFVAYLGLFGRSGLHFLSEAVDYLLQVLV